MRELKDFPTQELINDLEDTVNDIAVCKLALDAGITQYSGGSVQWRLEENQKMYRIITGELKRRGEQVRNE